MTRLLLILMLSACTGTTEVDTETRAETLWCLGACSYTEIGQSSETKTAKESKPMEKKDE